MNMDPNNILLITILIISILATGFSLGFGFADIKNGHRKQAALFFVVAIFAFIVTRFVFLNLEYTN